MKRTMLGAKEEGEDRLFNEEDKEDKENLLEVAQNPNNEYARIQCEEVASCVYWRSHIVNAPEDRGTIDLIVLPTQPMCCVLSSE